jgi:uncharacterized glyoxalase superfamily protein PhnB
MALYFFHSQTSTRLSDEIGTNLDHPAEARRQAIAMCGEMMQEAPEDFWGSRPWSVTVTDAFGLVLWEIYIDGTSAPAAATIAALLRPPSGPMSA